jgi:hypothetical protein
MKTNDARYIREIISRIVIANVKFNKKDSFYQQIGLQCEEETNKVLHLEHNFVWCWNLGSSESG